MVPGAPQAHYARAPPELYAQGAWLGGGIVAQEEEKDDPAWTATPLIEMYGNAETFNLNPLLSNCIMNNDYTRDLLGTSSFKALVAEARDRVSHVEPWQQGTQRTPSTAFCILMCFFHLGLREGHIRALLSDDKPATRCLAYLYLRYVLPPAQLWEWCEPGLHDDIIESAELCGREKMTVSQWLRGLLTEQKYYNTILPRIPLKIERDIKVKMMLFEEAQQRAKANRRLNIVAGTKLRAVYSDRDNDPAWYEAVVDAVVDDDKSTPPKFLVTFPQYGNQELVRLCDLRVDDEKALRDRDRDGRRASPSPSDSARGSHRHRRRSEDDDRRSHRHHRRHSRERSDDDDEDRRDRRRRRRRDDDERDGRRHSRRRRGENYDDDDNVGSSRRRRREQSEVREAGEEDDASFAGAAQSGRPPRPGESLMAGAEDRMRKVLQQQRDAASSLSDYARRPQGYKEALALKPDGFNRKRRGHHQ